MKNRERYLMLVMAGIACAFARDSCASRVAENPKVTPSKPPCNCIKVVDNKLLKKYDSLQSIFNDNGEYVLCTRSLKDNPDDEKETFYKLNLNELTMSLYPIGSNNQKIRGWYFLDKKTLFVSLSNHRYSIVVMGFGPRFSISLPFDDELYYRVPQLFLEQNRLYVLFGDRLLRWDIADGKAQALPEFLIKRLPVSKANQHSERSDSSPYIEKIEGEKVWIRDAFQSIYTFDLRTQKTAFIRKGESPWGEEVTYDRQGRRWRWLWTGKSLSKDSKDVPVECIFNLECTKEGIVASTREIVDLEQVFFDKDNNPLVWTKRGIELRSADGKWIHYDIPGVKSTFFDQKGALLVLTKTGAILKLVEGKWIKLVENRVFAKHLEKFQPAQILEDGRVYLLSGFVVDPRMVKVEDPSLKIINLEKNEYEVMRFLYVD